MSDPNTIKYWHQAEREKAILIFVVIILLSLPTNVR